MKQIFQQYGSAVIAVLVACACFYFVCFGSFTQKQGLGYVFGQVLEAVASSNSIRDNEAFDSYMKKVSPRVISKKTYITQNTWVMLSDCFEAVAGSGEHLPVYLREAWDLNREEANITISEDGMSIYASDPGVYWLQVYAIDDSGKSTSVLAKLLVNER